MIKKNSNLFRIAAYTMLALLVLLFIFWMAQFNRYHVLYYQEQMQLFRFNWFYFHKYLIQPGGIADYAGAFLTQFYFYPWIGATVLALLLAVVYLLFDSICRRNGKTEQIFAALLIPVFLLMMALVNQHFRLSYLVGLIIGLAGFRGYIALQKTVRYVGGLVIFLLIYIFATGNAMLFVILAILFELFSEKYPNRYLYLAALTVCAMIIPFFAYHCVYTANPREVFFAMTPVDFLYPGLINISAWLSFTVLYAFWRWLAGKVHHWQPAVWKVILSCILTIGMCIGSMVSVNNRRAEVITGMAFNIQNNNFEKAIRLGDTYPFSNDLISYFTNIALAESGHLPYRMFHYDQTGVSGLFLEWQEAYFTALYIGEVYFRLGMMQEAEHSAYEAMVGSPLEHNSQTIRRLVITSIIMRDTALFKKYIRLFDHTLFYRNWAERQRQYMALALAAPDYILPGTPQTALCDNFFHSYGKPDFILNKLLENNPDHRLAFEYLMAWYMLRKDVESVKKCMDIYFHRFNYPNIPVHYEEALLVYQNVNPSVNIRTEYPISELTSERFNNYVQAYKLATSNQKMMQRLYQQYGKTFWFFLHFKQPASLKETEDATNRY